MIFKKLKAKNNSLTVQIFITLQTHPTILSKESLVKRKRELCWSICIISLWCSLQVKMVRKLWNKIDRNKFHLQHHIRHGSANLNQQQHHSNQMVANQSTAILMKPKSSKPIENQSQ